MDVSNQPFLMEMDVSGLLEISKNKAPIPDFINLFKTPGD